MSRAITEKEILQFLHRVGCLSLPDLEERVKHTNALREELARARAAVKQASGYTLEEFEQMRREASNG